MKAFILMKAEIVPSKQVMRGGFGLWCPRPGLPLHMTPCLPAPENSQSPLVPTLTTPSPPAQIVQGGKKPTQALPMSTWQLSEDPSAGVPGGNRACQEWKWLPYRGFISYPGH